MEASNTVTAVFKSRREAAKIRRLLLESEFKKSDIEVAEIDGGAAEDAEALEAVAFALDNSGSAPSEYRAPLKAAKGIVVKVRCADERTTQLAEKLLQSRT